jgi:hypothetical protein
MGDLIAGLLQGESQLPLSRRGLARLGFDRLDCGFHTEWLQKPPLSSRRLICTTSPKRGWNR